MASSAAPSSGPTHRFRESPACHLSYEFGALVLGDPRLKEARKHFNKALLFFRDHSTPDFENAVKEAVCAVEAAGKALFPDAKAATLGDLVKWLVSPAGPDVPKSLGKTFEGIYAYRCGGDGVAHGGAAGG